MHVHCVTVCNNNPLNYQIKTELRWLIFFINDKTSINRLGKILQKLPEIDFLNQLVDFFFWYIGLEQGFILRLEINLTFQDFIILLLKNLSNSEMHL